MFNRRASLYAILFIALTSCSKDDILTSQSASESDNSQMWWPFPKKNGGGGGDDGGSDSVFKLTAFGFVQEQSGNKLPQDHIDETIGQMKKANVTLTRVNISLSKGYYNKSIDSYLSSGYHVQIIANWDGDGNGKRHFPTPGELEYFKSQAKAFFEYYAPYKDQIAFVAFENEWDWQIINNDAILEDYLAELAAVVPIGHQYGIKVTDGGITSTSLKRWTYSQLSGEEAEEWLDTYWVGLEEGYKYFSYSALMNIINTYTDFVKNVDLDYSNVHWYNVNECGYGFATATEKFRQACNKALTTCNEFYISTNSLYLFQQTVDEIKNGDPEVAVAYSGTDTDEKSVKLSDDMLEVLN